MKLKNWIKENGHSQLWMAKQLGIAPLRLHRICSGEREPTLAEVNDIYTVTHRKVTWRDFLNTNKSK